MRDLPINLRDLHNHLVLKHGFLSAGQRDVSPIRAARQNAGDAWLLVVLAEWLERTPEAADFFAGGGHMTPTTMSGHPEPPPFDPRMDGVPYNPNGDGEPPIPTGEPVGGKMMLERPGDGTIRATIGNRPVTCKVVGTVAGMLKVEYASDPARPRHFTISIIKLDAVHPADLAKLDQFLCQLERRTGLSVMGHDGQWMDMSMPGVAATSPPPGYQFPPDEPLTPSQQVELDRDQVPPDKELMTD